MPQEPNGAADVKFVEMVAEQLKLARRELAEIVRQLEELQQARRATNARVQHLSALIELDPGPPASSRTESIVPVTPTPKMTNLVVADADAVVALLTEHGEELYYRQRHEELVKLVNEIGGKDPANTLLAQVLQ